MQLFIDSANIADIKTALSWGIVDGVTTNPSLIAKEQGIDFREAIKDICDLTIGPVSAEAVSAEADDIVAEGRELSKLRENVVVKIPCTVEGLKAVKILEGQHIKTNVTLVFTPSQVLLAAKAGASYISPFVGRLDDIGEDGMAMIERSLQIIRNYHFKSQIIVASVRSASHVEKAALLDAHIATVPFKILSELYRHDLTDAGIKKFNEDWAKVRAGK
ncbi:MAG: fructose-6-phosphate aldolase [Candidatus Magasanikbacteria bacterium]|jgi:transaldolase